MGVRQRDKRWKEEGVKNQETSEKRKVESKWERSPEDERDLWDNKKLRRYEWNQKAEPEEKEKVRKLEGYKGEWRSREGGNQNQDRNKGGSSWNRVLTSSERNREKWELIARENQGWKMRKTNGQSKVRAKRELAKSVLKVLKKGRKVEKKWISVEGKKIQIEEK